MRSVRLSSAVAIARLKVRSANVRALEPRTDFSELLHPTGVEADAYTPASAAGTSDTCPATNLGVLNSAGGSIVGSTTDAGKNFFFHKSGCRDIGPDRIYELTVDQAGLWFLDTCTVPACWNTTLMVREETGGGCPGGDDRLDDDSDGVPDDCDLCPGSDDNVPGAGDDTDGDGVLNCNDKCNGVDDTVYGPECDGAIPTTSEWGFVVLTLLLLAGGKIYFGGRRLSTNERRR